MTLQDSLLEQIEPIPEVLEKVNRARERMHLSSEVCPCAPREDGRGCVGPVCMKEILETGICHCKSWKRKEVKDV